MKKIVIVNRSDSRGGAAVVSRRLMEALRAEGADARMLVMEKLTDSPYVEVAAPSSVMKQSFLSERLGIFLANGLDRSTLFRIDTASCGLPLWRHPLVKGADAILLNWVNQGMLSLKGIERILRLGKPVAWTMHDMWCMTGLCHHAGECAGFLSDCARCPLLGKRALCKSLGRRTWERKRALYSLPEKMNFVAVSNWLKRKGEESSLLAGARLSVIPNAFRLPEHNSERAPLRPDDRIRIAFGSARLDDPVKGLPILAETTRVLAGSFPGLGLAARLELVTFGGVKNPAALDGIAIPCRHLGMVRGEDAVRRVYEDCHIVVSTSLYETLPGTLVEAQAYGCVPVSFSRGGQEDIVSHLSTGYIAGYSDNVEEAARRMAEGVVWAAGKVCDADGIADMRKRMREDVERKFSPSAVARRYLSLLGLGEE